MCAMQTNVRANTVQESRAKFNVRRLENESQR